MAEHGNDKAKQMVWFPGSTGNLNINTLFDYGHYSVIKCNVYKLYHTFNIPTKLKTEKCEQSIKQMLWI